MTQNSYPNYHGTVFMRISDRFLLLLGLLTGLFLLTLLDAAGPHPGAEERRQATRQLVARFQLTDPALFTEARYTRHLSQADGHAAFQDHPVAIEHFPSGSLLPPPRPGAEP
ncbi:MAG: hypothetical protein OQL28_09560 [Sedimenticola sp.]|nr:hypothetical protein [Sedimenticola sp.]